MADWFHLSANSCSGQKNVRSFFSFILNFVLISVKKFIPSSRLSSDQQDRAINLLSRNSSKNLIPDCSNLSLLLKFILMSNKSWKIFSFGEIKKPLYWVGFSQNNAEQAPQGVLAMNFKDLVVTPSVAKIFFIFFLCQKW